MMYPLRVFIKVNRMKECNDCNVIKPYSEFTKAQSGKDGYEIRCKVCRTIRYNKSSVDKIVKRIYSTQLINSAKRGHVPPSYTEKELLDWVTNQSNWSKLYQNWIDDNYDKETKPSIDRIDLHKPYELNNIQLTTWKDNHQNAQDDVKEGRDTRNCRAVNAYNKDGSLIKEYYSINQAMLDINGNDAGIRAVANGKKIKDSKGRYYTPKSYKGLIWKWV